MLKYLLTR